MVNVHSIRLLALALIAATPHLACRAHGDAAEKPGAGGPPAGSSATDRCEAPRGTWYLHLSDLHLGASVAVQTERGDTSAPLWRAAQDALGQWLRRRPPAFILYTGDLPAHSPDRGDTHVENIRTALSDLAKLSGSIPLLYLPGNNDSLDWNYATFTGSVGDTPLEISGWRSGPTLHAPVSDAGDPEHGYYSAVPVPSLRVIALNTVMFSAKYPCGARGLAAGACSDESQPQVVERQLAWVKGQLREAARAGQKVLLAMHIPPGTDAYKARPTWKEPGWQDELLRAIDESPARVVGLAFGHTHYDELRRLFNARGGLELVALSAPGITPEHGNNPALKAVSLDASFEATDALTWYAVRGQGGSYEWTAGHCYRYSEVFGCAGQTLQRCLGAKAKGDLAATLGKIYRAGNGSSDGIAPGIDVRPSGAAPE